MNLYPAIDLLGGRCVRLSQGRFDQVTVYGEDPVAMAASFQSSGATHLHVVDLDGSRDGTASQADLVRQIVRSSKLAVQVGGGIRSIETAAAYVEAGVQRVVIGSLAVRSPLIVEDMVRTLGADRITLAIDVRRYLDDYVLAVQGWTETVKVSPWSLLERFLSLGVQHVLCTDISRDGELSGPNLDLYRELMERYAAVKLLASGGVAGLSDLSALRSLGASGAIVGKALYAGRFTLAEALECCANA